jgi:glutathione S-transferase
MKLYYTPGACSLASRIVACEAGLQIDYDKVDLKNQTTASGRCFNKINPKGGVPALTMSNGEVLTEASVVVQFLADQAPHSRLIPEAGSLERYRVQEWLNFISMELHGGFAPLWMPAASDAERKATVANLHRRFNYLEGHLEGRCYIMGEQFTVADAYSFTVLNWTHFHKVDMSNYPRILAYLKRVADRPRVKEALGAEGLKALA